VLAKKTSLAHTAFLLLVLGNINVNFARHWSVLLIYIGTPQTFRHNLGIEILVSHFSGYQNFFTIFHIPFATATSPSPHTIVVLSLSIVWLRSIKHPIVLSFPVTLIDIVLQSVFFFFMF
jgi:hypothetical protein